MNISEKYDRTISLIEKLSSDEYLNAPEIGKKVAADAGLSFRDLSAIFSYLLGDTLNSYIKSRKLNAAYNYLTRSDNSSISKAVDISGYADQPSFTKAFKKMFGLTPKEACINKDKSKLSTPMCWQELTGTTFSHLNVEEEENLKEDLIFGVSKTSFDQISTVLELEAFYGLPRLLTEYAYELSERTNHTIEDCFRYADSLRDYGGDYTEDDPDEPDGKTPKERLLSVAEDPQMQEVFFAKGISVSFISELTHSFIVSTEDLLKCDMTMLKHFPGFENIFSMSFRFYLRAYEYFSEDYDVEKYEDYFEEYVECLMDGVPIETAFEHIASDIEWDEAGNDSYGDDYLAFDIGLDDDF